MSPITENGSSTEGKSKEIYFPPKKEIIVNKSVPQIVYEGLKEHADKISQIDTLTGEEETNGSILSKSIRMAQNMKLKGLKPNDIISMCTYNNMQYSIPVFAALFIGAINAPTDPTSPLSDLIHCLKLTTPKIIFCEIELEEKIEKAVKEAELNAEIVVFGETERNTPFNNYLIPQEPEESFEIHEVKDLLSTAGIHFSSGTTGYPKGVCVTHYSLVFICYYIMNMHDYPPLRVMVTSSPFWIGNMNTLLINVMYGHTRIIEKKFDEKTFMKTIQDYKVDAAFLTPLNGLKLIQNPEYYEKYDSSCLKIVLTGGSATSPKQFLDYMKVFPHSKINSGYGMTETGGMILSVTPKKPSELGSTEKPYTGSPVPGFRYKVVDPETEKLCGPNEEGEIRVKFKGVMNAYYKNPKAYADAFDSEGYLKTGDVVYYDENYTFYYVTRVKEIFKYQGWHISPITIEAALIKHPNISEAVVFGTPSESDGDYPTAAVVMKDKTMFNEKEIIEYIQEKLPDRYHLRGGVFLVDNIPTTSTGKIQRRKLVDMVLHLKNIH